MGKEKTKGQKGLGQKHLQSRISYLYQAATYLASTENAINAGVGIPQTVKDPKSVDMGPKDDPKKQPKIPFESTKDLPVNGGAAEITQVQILRIPRVLINHLKAVSLKGQVRLTPEMKRSICKRCDVLLVPGSTSTSCLENQSIGGKKPWADVLVITCSLCGTAKRFPVGAKRQPRRPNRTSREKAPL